MPAILRSFLRATILAGLFCRHRIAPRSSYSDDREDMAVWLLLGGVKKFVDVGANDGLSCSNTALYAFRGGRGLCFEPNPFVFKYLKGFYRCTTRVECIAEGISESNGHLELRCDGLLSAMPTTEDKGLSQLLADYTKSDAPVISVPVSRLGDWLARRPSFQDNDLLSIDVEGHEFSVLLGIDWDRGPKPARALVIETHAIEGEKLLWRHRDFDNIDAFLVGKKYIRTAASRNNTIWLHEEDRIAARLLKAKMALPSYTWF